MYKVGEKDTLPLDKVRDEISSTMRSQRMQDALQKHSAVGHAGVEREIFCGSAGGRAGAGMQDDEGAKPAMKAPESGPK